MKLTFPIEEEVPLIFIIFASFDRLDFYTILCVFLCFRFACFPSVWRLNIFFFFSLLFAVRLCIAVDLEVVRWIVKFELFVVWTLCFRL